jgi:hypothetical protein
MPIHQLPARCRILNLKRQFLKAIIDDFSGNCNPTDITDPAAETPWSFRGGLVLSSRPAWKVGRRMLSIMPEPAAGMTW